MSDLETGRIINQAKADLAELDHNKLADSLGKLLAAEPVRWRQLLLIAGFWPEPSPRKNNAYAKQIGQTLACLMKAMKALLDRDLDHVDAVGEMMRTLQGFSVLQSYYVDIVEELKKLEFSKAPPEVQIHRLVAFVESQSRTAEKTLVAMQEGENFYDPLTGHAASVSSPFDNSKKSIGQMFEGICENIELGLRHIMHLSLLPATPTFQPDKHPFNDPDFKKFVELAGIWRMISQAWANMRFRGWRWICDVEGRHGCVPDDNEACIREQAGSIRYQEFVSQRIIQSATQKIYLAACFNLQKELAQSIKIPQAGEVWGGQVNLEVLRQYRSLSIFNTSVEEYVNHRHYRTMVDRVTVGPLGWREWCAGKAAMYCLADGIAEAATDQLRNDSLSCMRHVVVVHEDTLASILVECGALTAEQAPKFVNAIRFDPNRRSLEIWDQPLIPCGDRLLFLVPALIKTGNPARALENFVSQWGGASFNLRGSPFEKYVVTELRNRSTASAESGIKIQRSDGSVLEFDVVAWWEGYLLLLEGKCEKAVFSAADYHRAKAQIDKSIDQLIIRRDALCDVWAELREKAPSLGLPADFVGDDHVLCISITNIMDFTGDSRDGVVVTDDSCFFRFFGERIICKRTFDGEINEELEPIRANEVPHPSELMLYLLNPAPMRRLTDKMSLVPHVIPAITKRSSGFFSVHVEFDPSRDGGTSEWKPAFVSDKAYGIAIMLCQTKQSVSLDELKQDQELLDAAGELTRKGVIGIADNGPRLLTLKLRNPICARLPDKRNAVGENISGQMSWWLGKHFADKRWMLSQQFANYLEKQV